MQLCRWRSNMEYLVISPDFLCVCVCMCAHTHICTCTEREGSTCLSFIVHKMIAISFSALSNLSQSSVLKHLIM